MDSAWTDYLCNSDYIEVITDLIVKLIKKETNGIYNVGTEIKTMYDLAKKTNSNVKPIIHDHSFMRPDNVTMNIDKLKTFLKNNFFN